MKRTILFLSIFFTANSFGQSLTGELQQANTYDEVKALTDKDPALRLDLLQVNECIDTSALQKQFYTKKYGDIFVIGGDTYKVLYDTSSVFSRVNYIFLDGAKLSIRQIDSIRSLIMGAYKKGVPFDSLASKYNMDGNQNFGDTNWFTDGIMAKEFSDAVKQHKISDVFAVDIKQHNWFYVVKKTFETARFKQMAIVHIQKIH